MSEPAKPCEHEYEDYKENLTPERNANQLKLGMAYKKGKAYFTGKKCTKCGNVLRIDYKVES